MPREHTDLKVIGQVEHFASILVVRPGILPDEADFLLKRSPGGKVGYSCCWGATMDPPNPLGNAFERHWALDDLVVVEKSTRRKVDEWSEYLQVISARR
jgi:hypothetical protein